MWPPVATAGQTPGSGCSLAPRGSGQTPAHPRCPGWCPPLRPLGLPTAAPVQPPCQLWRAGGVPGGPPPPARCHLRQGAPRPPSRQGAPPPRQPLPPAPRPLQQPGGWLRRPALLPRQPPQPLTIRTCLWGRGPPAGAVGSRLQHHLPSWLLLCVLSWRMAWQPGWHWPLRRGLPCPVPAATRPIETRAGAWTPALHGLRQLPAWTPR